MQANQLAAKADGLHDHGGALLRPRLHRRGRYPGGRYWADRRADQHHLRHFDQEEVKSIYGKIILSRYHWVDHRTDLLRHLHSEPHHPINDPYRLNFREFRPGLVRSGHGFVPNAGLTLDLSLRNVLALARLPLNLGITYGWQFNEETLRSARFAYDIVSVKPAEDAPKLSDRITRGSGPSPGSRWQ